MATAQSGGGSTAGSARQPETPIKRPAEDASGGDAGGPARIHLACLSCRAKKAKCSGDPPRCRQCTKADLTCTWPDGRKRKRNKREMQIANRLACLISGQEISTTAQQASVFHSLSTLQQSGYPGLGAGALPPWMLLAPQPQQQQGQAGSGSGAPLPAMQPQADAPQQPALSPSQGNSSGWDREMLELARFAQNGGHQLDTGATGQAGPGPSTMQHQAAQGQQANGAAARAFDPRSFLSSDMGQDPWADFAHADAAKSAAPPTSAPDAPQPSAHDPTAAVDRTAHSAMLGAIANQVGYIEGEHGEPYLKVYYYRVSGSTAIHPGINRICLKLQLRQPNSSNRSNTGAHASPAGPAGSTGVEPEFDPATDIPVPVVYEPLLKLFFEHCAQHFPSVQPKRIYGRLQEGKMSAILLAAMCALAARFQPAAKGNLADAGNVFMRKAYELVVSNLQLPNTDSVTALLILSWCEFGQNSDSGQWNFSGLAMRMSQDQGFHKNEEIMYEDHAHFVRNKLLFYSTVITDRLLAFSTGRPCTIREDLIELPVPDEEDLPSATLANGDVAPPLPSPFARLVRLMMICGKIADLLNGIRGPQSASGPDVKAESLASLQTQLARFYSQTPPEMSWSASNFKEFINRSLGGIYLTFHCVANGLLASLYHPTILFAPNGSDTPMSKSLDKSIQLSLASSRLICEAIVFSDLVSPISLVASPQISQALYIAGLAFVHEIKQSVFQGAGDQSNGGAAGQGTAFLHRLAQQNLDVIINALRKMERYWAGAGVARHILEQRASGLGYSRIDFSKVADNIPTFVSIPDSGILKRFTGDLGLNNLSSEDQLATLASLSPASTSAPPAHGGVTENQFMLQNLLSQYSVDEMLVEPAGTFDPSFFDFDFSRN